MLAFRALPFTLAKISPPKPFISISPSLSSPAFSPTFAFILIGLFAPEPKIAPRSAILPARSIFASALASM